jgi:hypothetical protein
MICRTHPCGPRLDPAVRYELVRYSAHSHDPRHRGFDLRSRSPDRVDAPTPRPSYSSKEHALLSSNYALKSLGGRHLLRSARSRPLFVVSVGPQQLSREWISLCLWREFQPLWAALWLRAEDKGKLFAPCFLAPRFWSTDHGQARSAHCGDQHDGPRRCFPEIGRAHV